MSTQVQKTSLPPEWQPRRRDQGGLRQIRRDGNNQLTFKGQDKDEVVKRVVRKHPLFLARPILPAIGVVIAFFVDSILFVRFPDFRAIWGLVDLILLVCLLVAIGYFLWRDFLIWWVNIDIITNKRIISCRGLLQPTRKIIPLEKIAQISIDQDTLWSIFLAYGNVHIYMAGDEHVLKNVPRPREVRDAINGIFQDFKSAVAAKPAEKLPTLADPAMAALIGKLGKKDSLPTLPNADERYSHRHNPERLRRPLRRFGGPLRIPAEVTYASDEQTVMYVQRSKWLLIIRLIPAALGVLTAFVLTFVFPAFAIITVIAALVLLIGMGLLTVNYVDDVFILTNKRVIDIERKFIFFYEERIEIEYKNMREVKTDFTNIFQNMLDIGNVYIESPGKNPDIRMTLVDHPYFLADKINQIKNFAQKLNDAKTKNTRQDELTKWFTSVVAVLEKKMVNQGVPNLRTLDLWSAAERAAEVGMKVVPVGEDDSYPHIQAGKIVSQDPQPGTLMSIDPESGDRPQIHVVLSKRG